MRRMLAGEAAWRGRAGMERRESQGAGRSREGAGRARHPQSSGGGEQRSAAQAAQQGGSGDVPPQQPAQLIGVSAVGFSHVVFLVRLCQKYGFFCASKATAHPSGSPSSAFRRRSASSSAALPAGGTTDARGAGGAGCSRESGGHAARVALRGGGSRGRTGEQCPTVVEGGVTAQRGGEGPLQLVCSPLGGAACGVAACCGAAVRCPCGGASCGGAPPSSRICWQGDRAGAQPAMRRRRSTGVATGTASLPPSGCAQPTTAPAGYGLGACTRSSRCPPLRSRAPASPGRQSRSAWPSRPPRCRSGTSPAASQKRSRRTSRAS